MYKNILVNISFVVLFLFYSEACSQEQQKTRFLKNGFQINYGSRDNFYFKNDNYSFNIYNFKLQSFYKLKTFKSWSFNLVLQPQFQHIKHRLLNKAFIKPDSEVNNYLAYREKLAQLKTISFYAFEFGFQLRRPIIKDIHLEFTASLGAGYIDFTTERLARGFTFTETLSLGVSKKIDQVEVYTGFSLNHISNFDIQEPNSGYNTLNFEIGFRFSNLKKIF